MFRQKKQDSITPPPVAKTDSLLRKQIEASSYYPTEAEENERKGLLSIVIIPTDNAWVVVLVSFWQNFFKESVPLTILVFASTVHENSPITAEEKYYIGSFFLGLYHILTPLSCGLINWYSFRTISIAGPAIILGAMVASYFVQDVFSLQFVFLSVVGGLGNSMLHGTSKCMPSAWFCNKRGVACQAAAVGLGLGLLAVPFLTRFIFLEALEFSVRHSYWLYAGFYIPLIALGFVLPRLYAVTIQVLDSRVSVSTKVKFRDQETATTLARSMSILDRNVAYCVFRTYHNLVFPRVKDVVKERSVFILLPNERMMQAAEAPKRSARITRMHVHSSAVSFNVLGVQEIHMVVKDNLPYYGCRPFYRVDIFFTANVKSLKLYQR